MRLRQLRKRALSGTQTSTRARTSQHAPPARPTRNGPNVLVLLQPKWIYGAHRAGLVPGYGNGNGNGNGSGSQFCTGRWWTTAFLRYPPASLARALVIIHAAAAAAPWVGACRRPGDLASRHTPPRDRSRAR